jgi:hypothetical protein
MDLPRLATWMLILQGEALAALLATTLHPWMAVVFLGAHMLASLLAAFLVWGLLPAPYRRPRLWGLSFFFIFCLFVPFLGVVGLLGGVVFATRWPQRRRQALFRPVHLNPITSSGSIRMDYRLGDLLERLKTPTVADAERLKALLGTQNLPPRQANEILREALRDSADDIRLVAYGMLYQREKQLATQIDEELKRLKDVRDEQLRFMALSHLAHLYWEQIYQGLVQGDMRKLAFERAVSYAQEAVTFRPREGGLWILLGQLHLRLAQLDTARTAFTQAITAGLPAFRVVPYLAEVAYREGDFAEVQCLLRSTPGLVEVASLAPVIQFWQCIDAT